jgi:hypothetical protein
MGKSSVNIKLDVCLANKYYRRIGSGDFKIGRIER